MGVRIKKLRLENNMTLEELGNKVGVGKSTVRKWENGMIANMRRDKIAKLAEALNVSPAYLMGWNESSAPLVVDYQKPDQEGCYQRMSEYTARFLDFYNQLSSTNKEKVVSYTKGLLSTQQMEEDVRMAQAHTDVVQDAEPETEIIDVDMDDIESTSSIADAYENDRFSNIIDVIRNTDDIVEDEYPAPNAANDRKATSKQKAHADNIMENDKEWL